MTRRLPTVILVSTGGALGASARWAVVTATEADGRFPWVTLSVNLAGCLVVGLLAGARRSVSMFAGIGFAGGLTTFSTFSVEIATLLDDGHPGVAALYTLLSVTGGIVAIIGGRRFAPW